MATPQPQNIIKGALRKVGRELTDQGKPWALVGGLAVSVRSEPRFTRDIDIAVNVHDDQAAERLGQDLQKSGFRILAVVEQTSTKRLATLRLAPPGFREGLVVDVLLASSGIESEITESAEALEIFEGLVVPVASIGHLLAMKLLSRSENRPQDTLDIHALLKEAVATDIELAREAVRLIEARGFARRRNLLKNLDALLDSSASG